MPDTPRASKILLIRHTEKPDGANTGVSPAGSADEKSLTVRGWQRAGALVCLLAPPEGVTRTQALAAPRFLFASHSSSRRPEQSVLPLALKLGIGINLDFGKGDEDRLVLAAKNCEGVVLISWQHEFMAAVANAILGDKHTAPQEWPKDRFDVIWIFDLDPVRARYTFTQLPQRLLAGDLASSI
jgi:hypothetical protein